MRGVKLIRGCAKGLAVFIKMGGFFGSFGRKLPPSGRCGLGFEFCRLACRCGKEKGNC